MGLDVNSAFVGFSQIDLQARTSITLGSAASPVTWNLAQSTGISAPNCQLTLESGGSITLSRNSSIVAGPGWSVTLEAGRDFNSASAITPGTGAISLSPGSGIFAQDGSVNLLAGKSITFSAGSASIPGPTLSTALGGNINLSALSGALTLSSGTTVKSSGGSLTLAGATVSLGSSLLAVTGSGALSISANAGNLSLDTGPAIQTDRGPINLTASGNITWKGTQLGSANGGDIHVSALSGNINLGDATTSGALNWNLPSLNLGAPNSLLSLEAGNNILFANGVTVNAGSGWALSLAAGVDFPSPAHSTRAGFGGVYLNGGPADSHGNKPDNSGALQTEDGNISIAAGHEVLVGSGYIRTVAGGSLSIQTGDGNVDAGDLANAYDYNRGGYVVSSLGLGGIGTAEGGNVTINAGGNILAAASHIGAYGAEPGNVSLTAQNIEGNFLVRNGVGTLHALQDVGAPLTPDTFGLIGGGWNINAVHDVYVNEVYNPNGSLNDNRLAFGAQVVYQFDYASDAFVSISAGNSVQLLGSALTSNSDNHNRPAIYPPILNVQAGAGGVVLGNDLVLYPSSLGSLNIQTTDGGSLVSAPGKLCQLAVSDSSSPVYTDFLTGHSAVPLHLGSTGAGISLDISGDIQNLFLRVPEAANIRVHGNVANFAFDGQNLSSSDVTRLQINGDYSNHPFFSSETFSDVPNLNILTDPLLSTDPTLGARLTYNSTTHKLTLQNIMTPGDLAFLLNPTVYVINPVTGQREVDATGQYITASATFTTDTHALQQLFTDSQSVPPNTLSLAGLQLGGPGKFLISAHNMDLGQSAGILSLGPLNNPALGTISVRGADISLNLAGNLEMTSTEIASFNGGSIGIISGGQVDVGYSGSTGDSDIPRGIYTGHGGSVSVEALGDINLDGSRIATYNGGNVSVVSDTGTVDAGSGARGLFYVTFSAIDPATGQIVSSNDKFFGSGIMTTTTPNSATQVGDINVQAGTDIKANSGGIMQLAFNKTGQQNALVTLNAGNDIQAENSGVLCANLSVHAKNVEGLFVAGQNVNIQAQQNATVTVLAGASANVSAGQSVVGSVVGVGNVSVTGFDTSGVSVVSTAGNASSSSANGSVGSVGAFAGVAAPAAQKTVESADKTIASDSATQSNQEDDKKKKNIAKGPTLMHRVGRVTVILPNS
ncbi:MAG: hypothetical protein C5B50_20360 [Verrucomicrobia bacterium]|nr:MAG: hypothetical protein C5B50_20360 [Verrucomicrobiota bacterium]